MKRNVKKSKLAPRKATTIQGLEKKSKPTTKAIKQKPKQKAKPRVKPTASKGRKDTSQIQAKMKHGHVYFAVNHSARASLGKFGYSV